MEVWAKHVRTPFIERDIGQMERELSENENEIDKNGYFSSDDDEQRSVALSSYENENGPMNT